MKPGDKVILLGFIDGCSYETTGQTNLIIALENGERVEVPIECVIKEQVVKKDEIKLKDVIRRINRLDEDSKTYWLDTILNWFSLDFGLTKYRQGYEQGKFEGEYIPEKVKIPQFVADWIEQCKAKRKRLLAALLYTPEKVNSWVDDPDNQKLFARAYLDGYEVEKEKRYIIKLKGVPNGAKFLKYAKVTREWYFGMRRHYNDIEVIHTRKQLEAAGFGWVFSCEGVEVEEVEE